MKLPPIATRLILMATMVAPSPPSVPAVPTEEPGGEVVVLWPGGVPGGESVNVQEVLSERAPQGPLRDRIVQHTTRPLMTLFRPKGKPNGVTLLLVPGGAYERVVIDKEGFESAEWFAERGFECAVLRYRLPADGWKAGADAPVHDVMRALRLLRASGPPRTRVGVIGFSAGGHAVARLITDSAPAYAAQDPNDRLPFRPDFAVLMYPVIATTGPNAHAGTANQLRAAGLSADALASYSPDLHVKPGMPPTLLIHAADDVAVPPENSVLMHSALRAAKVPTELHVFDDGGHGFGMRGVAGKDAARWPELVRAWALADASAGQ
jgi:acetyl esterase/lipase